MPVPTQHRRTLAGFSLPLLLLLLVAVALASPAIADTDDSGSSLRILMIGNSLTLYNDLPTTLEHLLEMAGYEATVETVAAPGTGLPDHWQSRKTRKRIASGSWDVVILQQGPSATEGRPSLLRYGRRFAEEIRAAGARPAFYMVWPSRARHFDFAGVVDSYTTAARRNEALLLPAGAAWRAAWEIDERLPLYGPDGFHPNALGSYLAALTMFHGLTGEDPRGLPDELWRGRERLEAAPAVVRALQTAAAEVSSIDGP